MNYQIYGPYELLKKKAAKGNTLDLSPNALRSFWDAVDEDSGATLRMGRGCYVFALRAGKGCTPWYVGQSKGPFEGEVFTHKNRTHYLEVYGDKKAGTPVMFFVVACTPNGKLSQKSLAVQEADFVERLLIDHALQKNESLVNVSRTKFIRKMSIPGILNSPKGALDQPTKTLMMTLGIKTKR